MWRDTFPRNLNVLPGLNYIYFVWSSIFLKPEMFCSQSVFKNFLFGKTAYAGIFHSKLFNLRREKNDSGTMMINVWKRLEIIQHWIFIFKWVQQITTVSQVSWYKIETKIYQQFNVYTGRWINPLAFQQLIKNGSLVKHIGCIRE